MKGREIRTLEPIARSHSVAAELEIVVGAPEARNAYDLATIKKWLGLFLFRFFEISQFKRSAVPNGPKVISGGALSPRGDWRAPSDGTARVWLDELEANVP